MASKLNTEFNYKYQVIGETVWEKIKTLKGFLVGRKRAAVLEQVQLLKTRAKLAKLKWLESNGGHEHEILEKTLHRLRLLTNDYTAPEAACTSHRLSYSLLKELDDDLVQHLYLENDILFPIAIAMEKELLERH